MKIVLIIIVSVVLYFLIKAIVYGAFNWYHYANANPYDPHYSPDDYNNPLVWMFWPIFLFVMTIGGIIYFISNRIIRSFYYTILDRTTDFFRSSFCKYNKYKRGKRNEKTKSKKN